jgi:hypothetical protein
MTKRNTLIYAALVRNSSIVVFNGIVAVIRDCC